jgi:hypothetical protein
MRAHWIAALTALALVGCGGDSEPLTRDEFVAQADEICAEFSDEYAEAFSGLSRDASDEEVTDAVEEAVDIYTDMVDEMTDLGAPANDRPIARYLDRLERNARGFEKAADDGELLSEDTASAAFNSHMEELDLAGEAGMHDCSTIEY